MVVGAGALPAGWLLQLGRHPSEDSRPVGRFTEPVHLSPDEDTTVLHQGDAEGRGIDASDETETVDGESEVYTTSEEDGEQSGKGSLSETEAT